MLTDQEIAGFLFLLIIAAGAFSLFSRIIEKASPSGKDPDTDAQWYAAEARRLEAQAEYELKQAELDEVRRAINRRDSHGG